MTKKFPSIKHLEGPREISQSEIDSYEKISFPLFSFRFLQEVSFPGFQDGSFFSKFLVRLKKLSELGWKEIEKSSRHSFGLEKIPHHLIRPSLPSAITPEIPLFALRATGDNRPFIGFRNGKVFHILFIETRFGDIYAH